MSLANVLAVAGAARNLVLLGDPQQLAQPSQATHPPGAGASALEHILDGRATMPEGAGLPLDQTYRMHPDLCRYTSETFYDGKGRARPPGDPGRGAVHRIWPARGGGAAPGEHQRVTGGGRPGGAAGRDVAGCSWRDRDGAVRPVGCDGILIVTPYNAQIRAIQAALADRGLPGSGSGPWTSSRAARPRWSSTRWPPRQPSRRHAAWTFSTTGTG